MPARIKPASTKLKLFVGSSSETLDVAEQLQLGLNRDTEVTLWTQGVFQLARSNLENLLEQLREHDFAAFVLGGDDLVEVRGQRTLKPRDNVIFELGLFMGHLGRDRAIIIHEHGHGDRLRMPTDLDGIVTARFEGRSLAALGPTCTTLRNHMRDLGSRVHARAVAVPPQLGVERIFLGSQDDLRRNERKQELITASSGDVVLLAHSGYTYLSLKGKHRHTVEHVLKSGRRFRAVLLNPFSDSAIEMYLSWLRAFEAAGYTLSEDNGSDELLVQQSRLQDALNSYERLRDKFENSIDLKLTSFDSGCSVLWTDKGYFIEPYYRFDPYKRARDPLVSYELELRANTPFADMFDPSNPLAHASFYLRYSMPFESWKTHREGLFEAACTNLDLMKETEQISAVEAGCLRRFLEGFR